MNRFENVMKRDSARTKALAKLKKEPTFKQKIKKEESRLAGMKPVKKF